VRPESETSEAAVSAARVAAAVAAAAFTAVALVSADFAAADFAAVLRSAAVFVAVLRAAAVFSAVVCAAVVFSAVVLAVVARTDSDFAADSVFAAAVRAALDRAAVCAAVAFAAVALAAGGFATGGFATGGLTGTRRVVFAPVGRMFGVPVSSVSGASVPVFSAAAGGFTVDDRAVVGLPAVDPAGFARAADGRGAGGFRTAGLRAGFGLSAGARGAAASVVDCPSRAGSSAAARGPRVGSSGSEFGVSGVTSLTYQGPSDSARSSRNECAQAVKRPCRPSQNGYTSGPALPPNQPDKVHSPMA
jgi:hypothetical protein